MQDDVIYIQYAVEVEGRGYLLASDGCSVGADHPALPNPTGGKLSSAQAFYSEMDAEYAADRLRTTYDRLNAPELAERVRVVGRRVTTMGTEWSPLPQPAVSA